MSQQPPPYYVPQGQHPPGGQPPYPPSGGQPAYPPGGYPPGQQHPPPGQYPPGQQPVIVQPGQQPTTAVVVGATCRQCGRGTVSEEFTACGIILAICCFPWGIICCLMMKEKKCSSCGATF